MGHNYEGCRREAPFLTQNVGNITIETPYGYGKSLGVDV